MSNFSFTCFLRPQITQITQIKVAKATIIMDLTDWLRSEISGFSRNNQNKSM